MSPRRPCSPHQLRDLSPPSSTLGTVMPVPASLLSPHPSCPRIPPVPCAPALLFCASLPALGPPPGTIACHLPRRAPSVCPCSPGGDRAFNDGSWWFALKCAALLTHDCSSRDRRNESGRAPRSLPALGASPADTPERGQERRQSHLCLIPSLSANEPDASLMNC